MIPVLRRAPLPFQVRTSNASTYVLSGAINAQVAIRMRGGLERVEAAPEAALCRPR